MEKIISTPLKSLTKITTTPLIVMYMQKVRPPTFWPQQRTWNTSKAGRFVFESTIDRHIICPTTKPNRLFPALQFSRCSFHINKLSIQVTCDNGEILGGAAGHNAARHRAKAQRWPELAVFADIRRDPRQNSCSSIVAGRPLFDVRFTVTVWPAPLYWTANSFILTFICPQVPQRHEAEELLCRDAAFATVTNNLYVQETVPFVGFRTRINIAT